MRTEESLIDELRDCVRQKFVRDEVCKCVYSLKDEPCGFFLVMIMKNEEAEVFWAGVPDEEISRVAMQCAKEMKSNV